MKIIIVCSTLDLSKPYGATPSLWQLFKAFYEEGVELLVIPYHGHPTGSVWWRSYQNPNYYKGLVLEKLFNFFRFSSRKTSKTSFIPILAQFLVKPNLYKLITKIMRDEKNIDAVFFIAVPLNHLKGLANQIRKNHKIPIIYNDLDVPTSLPSHGGFTFNYLRKADLGEFDSIIVPSEGSVKELKELGARNLHIVHFGVDPVLFSPVNVEKDIDFFFFGNGGFARVRNLNMMVAEPSRALDYNFVVSGRGIDINLGKAKLLPPLSFIEFRNYCCRTKVNLNVVRDLHADVFATSTSRPFELAAMQCCIVSAPYNGLENWFDLGKEILVAKTSKEFIEIYQMLIDNEDMRIKMGTAARNRVIKDHTSRHRARQIIQILKNHSS
ncbi:MAG TPA: glycosyltransferase [Nitrososphaeraceae archaeon]|nr:glycosyltransferase [Nitrososphaeraceae archaeon]HZO10840.1 glycosyltransferase [Nitrososphaeraceae archaeon]